jgi:excisionase family DNA binding protein
MPARQDVLDEPRQLTLAEVAAIRRVHINTVRRWVARGYLRAERVGPRIIRINADDLAALGRTIPSAAAR